MRVSGLNVRKDRVSESIAPEGTMGMIGRQEELGALVEILRGFRVVTIVAPGGMGKTTLAEALVERLLPERAIWFAPLAELQSSVSDGVSEALGVVPDRLGAVLAEHPDPVLVLDNAEHILGQVLEFIDQIFELVPNLSLVITSREPIGHEDEMTFRLEPLSHEDATTLFVERARQVDIKFVTDEAELHALARAVDGIPLALEMAASQVLVASVFEIRESLESRIVGGKRSRLGQVLESSWLGLPSEARAALRRLSLLHDGFDRSAASALIEHSDAQLETLVIRAWLQRDERQGAVRFRLPNVLRMFARARLEELPAEHARVIDQAARHFSSLNRVGRFGRCPPEFVENLYTLAKLHPDPGIRVGCVRATEFSARLHFGLEKFRVLALDVRLQGGLSPLQEAHMLWCESLAELAQTHISEGIEHALDALRIALEFDDVGLHGDACFVLGSSHAEDGRLIEAGEYFERGVAAVEGQNDLLDLKSALLQKVAMIEHVGGLEGHDARKTARLALDAARMSKDRYQEARSLSTQAAIVMHLGELERARRTFEESDKIDEELDDWMCRAHCQLNLGNIAMRLEEFELARKCFEEATEKSRQAGYAMVESMAMVGLAVLSLSRGVPTVALLEDALALLEGIDIHVERVGALAELAVHHIIRKDFDAADTTLGKAWRIALHIQEPAWIATIACYRGLVAHLTSRDSTEWFDAARAGTSELVDAFVAALHKEEFEDPDVRPPAWVVHDPFRVLTTSADSETVLTLKISDDGREVRLPDETVLDFSRRGPLRLLLLALARSSLQGEVLGVADILAAAWPGEIVTYDAARMRVYTAVKRLRRMGLEDWIVTNDQGYFLSPAIRVELRT